IRDGRVLTVGKPSDRVFRRESGLIEWNLIASIPCEVVIENMPLAIDPESSDKALFACEDDGDFLRIYRTTDGGFSWPMVSSLGSPKVATAIGYKTSQNAYATVIYSQAGYPGPAWVFQSTNAGENWIEHDVTGAAELRSIATREIHYTLGEEL